MPHSSISADHDRTSVPGTGRTVKAVSTFAALCVLAAGVAVTASTASAEDHRSGPVIQKDLNGLVKIGFPAALASVRGRDGQIRNYTAGVGDIPTQAPVPVNGQVRIGSNTKTFVSVAVLQLVGQGKIDLEAPIERYLPNLLRGQGIDGHAITVRQLLQHTSGLPEYTDLLGPDVRTIQHVYLDARTLIDMALTLPATFAPGTSWSYSNTNYIVAGLLLEKVTGRPVSEVIDSQVIKRAGLRDTYFPPVGEQDIRERHPNGYQRAQGDQPLLDVSSIDGSWAGAAGQIVSTPSDVNKFYSELIGGKLLPPAQLAEMRTTIPAPGFPAGARYGLGLAGTPLSCGGVMWGHGGNIYGFEVLDGVTEDGRAATVAVTALPQKIEEQNQVAQAVDDALCK